MPSVPGLAARCGLRQTALLLQEIAFEAVHEFIDGHHELTVAAGLGVVGQVDGLADGVGIAVGEGKLFIALAEGVQQFADGFYLPFGGGDFAEGQGRF